MLCLIYFVSFCDTSFRFVSSFFVSFRFVFVSQFSSTLFSGDRSIFPDVRYILQVIIPKLVT